MERADTLLSKFGRELPAADGRKEAPTSARVRGCGNSALPHFLAAPCASPLPHYCREQFAHPPLGAELDLSVARSRSLAPRDPPIIEGRSVEVASAPAGWEAAREPVRRSAEFDDDPTILRPPWEKWEQSGR